MEDPTLTTPPVSNDDARAAAAAEARAESLTQQLAALQSELDQARKAHEQADRARDLQRLLIQARAVDLDAATLLAQRDIEGHDKPDLAQAVNNLRRRKPHLFRAAPATTSMSPRLPDDPAADANELATVAATTGDRRALLRYLRARRPTT